MEGGERRVWQKPGKQKCVAPAGGNDHEGRKAQATCWPTPEVLAKPLRRRFTAEYKLRILKEVDA